MVEKSEIVKIIRALAKAVQSCSDKDIDSLLTGNAELLIVHSNSLPLASNSGDTVVGGIGDFESLIECLKLCASREAALVLLEGTALKRQQLEDLSRKLNIPIIKSDKVDRIRDKIVNNIVGSRLNSRAIRGE
jgi:hypothetical protein